MLKAVRSVTPLAEAENQLMRIRKYASADGALAGIVTKFEIKSHYERQGIKIGVIELMGPIRTTGAHKISIDGFPITVEVEGFS